MRSKNNSAVRLDRKGIPSEMGTKPELDPTDGSVKIVEEFIKLHAKNPSTFEFLEGLKFQSKEGIGK